MWAIGGGLLIAYICITESSTAESTTEVMATKPALIKVAALCGSLRKASFHRGLIRSAIQLTEESESLKGIEIEEIDISSLPMLNTDLEGADGMAFPPVVEDFRSKILGADSILFASPEYNFSVTAILKNAIDWASRPPNVWGGKAAAIVSAGGGCGGALQQLHLRQIGVFLDLHFVNKPLFAVKAFEPPPKFDADGNLTDVETKELLKKIIEALHAHTLRIKGN